MYNENEFLKLENYEKKDKIGQGSFGEVFKVLEKSTGAVFAAKISLNELTEEQKSLIISLTHEVNIISQLDHPSILKFIGYSPINFDQDPKPVIITEYLPNSSLENIINLERKSLAPDSWTFTKKLINIYGIASAMSYLHAHNIIHRDLKPANILEDIFLFPKIADFGLSKNYHKNIESMTLKSTIGMKGTPIYIPPESWETNEYTKSGDVYAFSIILYELLTLEEPFKDFTFTMMFSKVVNQGYRPEFKYPIPKCYKDLITRCWSSDAEKRPTFAEIVEELKNNQEYITDEVDKDEFLDYIDLIDNYHVSFNPQNKFKQIILSTNLTKINEIEIKSEMKIKNHFDELRNLICFQNLPQEVKDIFKEELEKEDDSNKMKIITIKPKKTIILYANDQFVSPDFINTLNFFDAVKIEVKYPSSIFETIVNQLFELEKVKIFVVISDMKQIDDFPKMNDKSFSIVIESPITSIEKEAFKNCKSIKDVSIVSSCITSIDEAAFMECSSLERITIPSSVTKIGLAAFRSCSSLEQITIPSSVTKIDDLLFLDCSSLEKVLFESPSSVKSIGINSFISCLSLTEIEIPPSVTEIKEQAFYDCHTLRKISIPPSVASIGYLAFGCCSSLIEIKIPSSLSIIQQSIFNECISLREITIPSNVKEINSSAFGKCSSLEQITFESHSLLIKICGWAFSDCSSLLQVTIPSSVKSICEFAFHNCKSLTKVSFQPNSELSVIEDYSFYGCCSLVDIEIPSSVIEIKRFAFKSCKSLRNFKIPSNVSSIGDYCFSCCSSLTQIDIPQSVTKIGKGCFLNCSSLSQISLPFSIKKLFVAKHIGIPKNTKIIKH